YELIKGVRFAYHYKKEKSYNRQQTDTLFKKRKMSALRFAESIMRLPWDFAISFVLNLILFLWAMGNLFLLVGSDDSFE
ncbi:MAG: hypothetical protein SOT15_06835, partial [Treponema sp.]|nr:hypothetical protein [Treponema sp.]